MGVTAFSSALSIRCRKHNVNMKKIRRSHGGRGAVDEKKDGGAPGEDA